MSISLVYDVTGQFLAQVPGGVTLAGYVTGSSGIPWTAAAFAARPGTIQIAQAVDLAADVQPIPDVLDVERGAATTADCAPWAKAMLAAFTANTRPGQRRPAIYCSASVVSDVVNALLAGGVASGVGLWVANWNLSEAQAIADVVAASGPFPIVGIQFTDTGGGGDWDIDVFSTVWLADQSGVAGSTIAQGSSGPAVVAAQTTLNTWVSPKLTVDGLFGGGTLVAVQAFQHQKGLKVDGVVGPATWKALEPSQPDPKPVPKAAAAPQNLKTEVRSTAAAGTLSWSAVAGVPIAVGYHLQAEWWKPSFGWVLVYDEIVADLRATIPLSAQAQYRWRVAANEDPHIWTGWVEFRTA